MNKFVLSTFYFVFLSIFSSFVYAQTAIQQTAPGQSAAPPPTFKNLEEKPPPRSIYDVPQQSFEVVPPQRKAVTENPNKSMSTEESYQQDFGKNGPTKDARPKSESELSYLGEISYVFFEEPVDLKKFFKGMTPIPEKLVDQELLSKIKVKFYDLPKFSSHRFLIKDLELKPEFHSIYFTRGGQFIRSTILLVDSALKDWILQIYNPYPFIISPKKVFKITRYYARENQDVPSQKTDATSQ